MNYLLARLREQGTHTGVALLSIIVLLAHAAGINVHHVAESAAGIAAALGALAATAKTILPDAPKPPPRP